MGDVPDFEDLGFAFKKESFLYDGQGIAGARSVPVRGTRAGMEAEAGTPESPVFAKAKMPPYH